MPGTLIPLLESWDEPSGEGGREVVGEHGGGEAGEQGAPFV